MVDLLAIDKIVSTQISKALDQKREELSQALFTAIRDKRTATWQAPQSFNEVQEWGKAQLLIAIDLLIRSFATQDLLFQDLFNGWMISRVVADLSGEGIPSDYKPAQALELARPLWVEILKSISSPKDIEIFAQSLTQSITKLAVKPSRKLNVLFIGDCIHFEIMPVLMAQSAAAEIQIIPTLVNEKVQPILRNRLRTFSAREFDLIFFSPFSHSYLPDYANLLMPKNFLIPATKLLSILTPMLKDIGTTLETLLSHFAAKIYVHNTAGTVQSFDKVSGFIKNIISWKNRTQLRKIINEFIANYINDIQINNEARLQLIDEDSLRRDKSEFNLGKVYFNSYSFHPTELGINLGRNLYYEAIYINAFLSTKKVVVCDLDNTLWDGVIGEGAVKHYLDRQAILKELKNRGVLLSICSKNDANNVHWRGGGLTESDFVSPQINWQSKVSNIKVICDELNLKLKDFVFIDDRADELERVKNAFPEMVTLDATKANTWRLISQWQRSLPLNPGEDRTQLYHERVARDQFVKDKRQQTEQFEDETDALKALNLSVLIKEAEPADLKRVVELINRTNQFNLCGSRTNLRELQDGLGTLRAVITAEASDKFGRMGIVGVMCAEFKSHQVEIPIFVLSCRVFGFGIEYALLNSLKALIPAEYKIIGHYKETQFNKPCVKLYPDSGLNWNGKQWIGQVAQLPSDPAWLAIEYQFSYKSLAL